MKYEFRKKIKQSQISVVFIKGLHTHHFIPVCVFQVFYPTLNINGKLFVAMDQNGVSPPPLQGQLPACTMEKVKEESVSTVLCMCACVCVCACAQWKQWWSLQPSNTQICELWISALHFSTLISWAKDTHTLLHLPSPISKLWYSPHLYTHTHTHTTYPAHIVSLLWHRGLKPHIPAQACYWGVLPLCTYLHKAHTHTHTSARKQKVLPVVWTVFKSLAHDFILILFHTQTVADIVQILVVLIHLRENGTFLWIKLIHPKSQFKTRTWIPFSSLCVQ